MKTKFMIVPFFAFSLCLMLTSSCKKDNEEDTSIKDADGNIYHAITIGTQIWMVENLKTTKYRDGVSIANITDNDQWASLSTGAYCDFDNIPSNSDTYGRLYNWYVVNSGKLAPSGWHIARVDDWNELIEYLGGINLVGKKLNDYGFNALLGGWRSQYGGFGSFGNSTSWWTPETASDGAYSYNLFSDGTFIKDNYKKSIGMYVRCIKD